MKLIVAGSRSIKNYEYISKCIDKTIKECSSLGIEIDTIVSSNSQGIDKLAEKYAKDKGLDLVIFPVNWDRYGKSAGYKRNMKMVEYADSLLAIWDGISAGTKHMIDIAKNHKLKVWINEYK